MRILYSFVGSVDELLRALTPCTGNMYSCPCADCVDEREFYFAQDPCDWGTGETMEQANQRSLAEI